MLLLWGGGTEITSGTATCIEAITAYNYCKWVKSGHIVMVDIITYVSSNSAVKTFSGLPKPYIEIHLSSTANYSKYSCITGQDKLPLLGNCELTVDGNLIIRAHRSYGYFRDYFTYISSE